jgi:DEAD/DEAH box helicase domain-containing protein
MDVDGFLRDIQAAAEYRGQIVHVHEVPPRRGRFAGGIDRLAPPTRRMLAAMGIDRLYSHQAEAIAAVGEGRDVVVVTGTASGKSLCYLVPIMEMLAAGERAGETPATRAGGTPVVRDEVPPTALLLFPTKALTQDQWKSLEAGLRASGLEGVLTGVYDGDTPPHTRRKLRDHARVVLSNPDMLHAAIMPQHARWARFLAGLRFLVLDELHVYSGIFGANMANLLRRLERLCAHYRGRRDDGTPAAAPDARLPRIIACSATIGNPGELAERLTGREVAVLDADGSPRGRRVYVLWNPPRLRQRVWRSRRSANVEAHELMAELVRRGVATITFSKAKMTAEMIHRYVREALHATAPRLMGKVTAYRGGYRPEDRREIERRLFSGELLGVSATRALELGIDVGALEACIVVGYPGRLSSFFQQAGRAGRGDTDALVVLVGLDTSVNQYVMTHPEYLFSRAVEQAVVDRDNPFVVMGHLRCAAHELPLGEEEALRFGSSAAAGLKVLEANRKVRRIGPRWYHSASETPQHEMSLRDYADRNVLIEDADTGEVIGQVNKFDAPPILHEEAIYMHRGDTYRVLRLDLERNIATVRREDVDYYTQPIGGTDIHHVDACLREKPFGTGRAYWGEVTAYFRNEMYEKVRFYELDTVSRHALDMPIYQLETMGLWMVPPEGLMAEVRAAGLDAHAGLRGIGYATRMLLPLFITCDTLDFSHTIGSVNSPWNAIFIYERYRLGLGYTKRAYELLGRIMPAVLDGIRACPCEDGCPCCVGKPLRPYAVWNVERGEASVPSKAAARMILQGFLGDMTNLAAPDDRALSDDDAAEALRLEQALRRRLERGREPEVFHPIKPQAEIETAYPRREADEKLRVADVARRAERRADFQRDLRKRLAKKLSLGGLPPEAMPRGAPPGMATRRGNLTPLAFGAKAAEGQGPSRTAGEATAPSAAQPGDAPPPADAAEEIGEAAAEAAALRVGSADEAAAGCIRLGDPLAARARRLKKSREMSE